MDEAVAASVAQPRFRTDCPRPSSWLYRAGIWSVAM